MERKSVAMDFGAIDYGTGAALAKAMIKGPVRQKLLYEL
jgi:hypothetical protein